MNFNNKKFLFTIGDLIQDQNDFGIIMFSGSFQINSYVAEFYYKVFWLKNKTVAHQSIEYLETNFEKIV